MEKIKRRTVSSRQLASRLDDKPESILNNSVIVADYWNEAPYFDEPKLWQMSATLATPDIGQAEIESTHAGGVSPTKIGVCWKTAGEAVERFSLLPTKQDKFLRASWHDLRNRALDPNAIAAGRRFDPPNRRRLQLSWIKGTDQSGESVLLPAQLVFVPFLFPSGEPIIRPPITTGAAAGSSLAEAKQRALLEVIERDAFMLWWLRGWAAISLRADNDADQELRYLLTEFTRYRFQPHFLLLHSDVPVFVVACILEDISDRPKVRFTVGARAALDLNVAVRDSLLEAQQLRCWLRSLTKSKGTPESLEGRAQYLMSSFAQDALERALKNVQPTPETALLPAPKQVTAELVGTASGEQVFFVDLTKRIPPTAQAEGWFCVKAIVPGFQPLYLTESLQDIAWRRIERIERSLRLVSHYNPGSVNPVPHPFL